MFRIHASRTAQRNAVPSSVHLEQQIRERTGRVGRVIAVGVGGVVQRR